MEQHFPIPNKNYKVLCRCYTFNQASYIENTLNGFVLQQTNFPFVCLVVDDCSTDGEQDVIKAFLNRECGMDNAEYYEDDTAKVIYAQHKTNNNCYMAVYLLKENLYKQKERKMVYVLPWREHCEYEAVCEGDDYWIDSFKLQKQADYLDANQSCGLVYTKFKRFNQQSNSWYGVGGTAYRGLRDLIVSNRINTLTVLYRISCTACFECIKGKKWLMGDYPKWLCIAEKYDVHFIDDVTSVYRVLDESASHSSKVEKQLAFHNSLYDIKRFFAHRNFSEDLAFIQFINDMDSRAKSGIYHQFKMNTNAKRSLLKIKNKVLKDYVKILFLSLGF